MGPSDPGTSDPDTRLNFLQKDILFYYLGYKDITISYVNSFVRYYFTDLLE